MQIGDFAIIIKESFWEAYLNFLDSFFLNFNLLTDVYFNLQPGYYSERKRGGGGLM